LVLGKVAPRALPPLPGVANARGNDRSKGSVSDDSGKSRRVNER
jgi:hypothetical protein